MFPHVSVDSVTSDTWWRRRDTETGPGCGPGPALAPVPAQHRPGHNTATAPTTIEQRQSRPGARLVHVVVHGVGDTLGEHQHL